MARRDGRWLAVGEQRMDAVIVIDDTRELPQAARCPAGDRIVCGVGGVRVTPEVPRSRTRRLAFMSNEVSSRRRVEVGVERIAAMMREAKAASGRSPWSPDPWSCTREAGPTSRN